MEYPTISERVAADQITVRSVLVGTCEASHGMWQRWVCILSIPDASESFYPAETPYRADAPNEEGATKGRTLVLNRVEMSVRDRDAGNAPKAAEVLQMICQNAVDIENSGGSFWTWRDETGDLSVGATESNYQDWEESKIDTRSLKVFLGDRYSDYLWKTEWE